MHRNSSRTCVLKTKLVCWLWLLVHMGLIFRTATGDAPPGKGPWPLHQRLIFIAQLSASVCAGIHVLRHVGKWTEAKRADWVLAAMSGVGPPSNVISLLLLPTFDITRTSWPMLTAYHMLLCGLVVDLPPSHLLVQLCICISAFGFLDFQKTCSLARSGQLGKFPASAQDALHGGCYSHGLFTHHLLHQGLPMLLLGITAMVLTCTFVQRSKQEARRAVPPKSTKSTKSSRQSDAAGATGDAEPCSPSPPALPLESLGIHLFSALGLRPLFTWYQSCIMGLAARAQRVVLGAVCLPLCAYYMVRMTASRFESTPFRISAEETMVLTLASYVVGRDSSKLDMMGFLQNVQSRLGAAQALLVDLLPDHLVARMLNNMEGTGTDEQMQTQTQQQQQQQQQQRRRQQGTEGRKLQPGRAGRRLPAAAGTATGSTSPSQQRIRRPVPRRRSTRSVSSPMFSRLSVLSQPGCGPEQAPESPFGHAPGAAEPGPSPVPLRQARDQEEGGALGWRAACLAPATSSPASVGSFHDSEGLPLLEVHRGGSGALDLEGLVQGVASPAAPSATPSHLLLQRSRPSLYAALSRNLSSGLWASLQSHLAAHGLGLLGGAEDSLGTHTPLDQEQGQEQDEAPGEQEFLSGRTTAASHECVTLFFSDICGFSSWAGRLPPETVMSTLDELYVRLDDLILNEFPGLYKVETVGDAYIVAANLLTPDPDHAATAVRFALRAQQEVHQVLRPDRDDGETLQMRIGLHSGSIMSGIVGKIRRRFCLFGDTMNMAARTESSCPPGSVQLTAATHALAEPSLRGEVSLRERGEVQVKGSDKPLIMFLASAPQQMQRDSWALPDDQGPTTNSLEHMEHSQSCSAPGPAPVNPLVGSCTHLALRN